MGVLKKGYVQVYTGNGKGKTTAALGLALRASGAGLKVYIQQFAKKNEYSEIKALRGIRNIRVSQCGSGSFITGKPGEADIECAKRGFREAKRNIFSKNFDLVILDEINIAMKLGLIKTSDVTDLIKRRPGSVELVMTGRDCPAVVRRSADLVTVMVDKKHPFRRGVVGRKGIE